MFLVARKRQQIILVKLIHIINTLAEARAFLFIENQYIKCPV